MKCVYTGRYPLGRGCRAGAARLCGKCEAGKFEPGSLKRGMLGRIINLTVCRKAILVGEKIPGSY